MAEKSGLFNSTSSNKNRYQDADFAKMLSLFVGRSGYIPNYKNELKVVQGSSDLKVKISTGAAWLGVDPGWWYVNDEEGADVEIALSDPGAGQLADYRIVLRMERESELKVFAAAKPYSVSLSSNLIEYELTLAKVTVNGDTSSIGTITDERVPCVANTSAIEEKSTGWTLSFSDINKFIKCINSSDITVTVPANSSVPLPINTEMVICQYTTHTVTAAPQGGSSVQIRSLDGNLTSDGQYSAFTLRKIGEDEWIAIGAMTS